MRHVFFVTILSLLILPLQASDKASFSLRDLKGPYGFSFDGFIITPEGPAPVAAVGQAEADGKGNISSLVRTLNVSGGVGIQEFAGVYTINSADGTGTACLCGSAPVPLPSVPELPPFFGSTYETFALVITGKKRDEVEFLGIGLRFITGTCPLDLGVACPPTMQDVQTLDANLTPSETPLGVVQGVARKQSQNYRRDN